MDSAKVSGKTGGSVDGARRRWGAAALVAFAGLMAGARARAQRPAGNAAGKRLRTIVHVTDGEPDKWSRVLGFVQGLESTPDSSNLAIALVVQGLAIEMLKADAPVAKGVSAAIARGVEVVACEYSMKVRKVPREELNASVVHFVPFGGVEIVKRQAEGWAYLRP